MMPNVILVGGTNDGRKLFIKHGRECSVARRIPVPDAVTADPGLSLPLAVTRERYRRPDNPVIIAGVERWLVVDSGEA